MKIGSNHDVSPVQGTQPVGRSSPRPAGAPAQPGKGVEVNLSSTAKALGAGASSTEGDFDAAKVENLRRQIQDGSYKVNPAAIADKLLANAQDMLNAVAPPRTN